MGCIQALLEGGYKTMDCKQKVNDDFNDRLQRTMTRLVWSHPGMDSWYKNSEGRVTTTSPWLLREYWTWTREPNLYNYDLV